MRKNLLFFVFFSIQFISFSPAFALHEEIVEYAESDGRYAGYEEEPDSLEGIDDQSGMVNDELSLKEDEIRSNFSYGASFGFGVTNLPWQTYSLTGHKKISQNKDFDFFVGYGKSTINDVRSGREFDMKIATRSAGVGGKWFFSDALSLLFWQGSIAYLFFDGQVKPQSSEASDNPDNLAAKLTTSFSAHGPVVSTNLGLAKTWENGFYFEYTLTGMAKIWLLSDTATQDQPGAKGFYRDLIHEMHYWGFINLSLGYFF